MKILLVDGDLPAAQRLGTALVEAGWGEVVAVGSAGEAVDHVNREGAVDALVTQVSLPDLDGFALVEAMQPHLPGLRVVYLADGEDVPAGQWPVLRNPADGGALAAALAGLFPAEDPLVGTTLGEYWIDARAGEDSHGAYYAAVQTAINRPVELHVLFPERTADPAAGPGFLAAARAKARVHNPAVLSVFEAGEIGGWFFYTSEPREGSSLADLAAQGSSLPAAALLQILHVVAETMVQLGQSRIAHEPLSAHHVMIDGRRRARLVNIATDAAAPDAFREEMRRLAVAVEALAPADPSSGALRRLLGLMRADALTVRSWTALIYEVKRCQGSEGAEATYRMDASGEAALEGVRRERRRARILRGLGWAALGVGGLAAAGWAAWFFSGGGHANPALERMVAIPATVVVRPGSGSESVPPFWIDQYEVSIGQYADFLAWTQRHPGTARSLLPEGTPENHSFVPAGWAPGKSADGETPGYFAVAKAGGSYEGSPLSLDAPVFGVDWPSAYAYALWKDRRLPSDLEWEVAASGGLGRKYPWGAEARPGAAHLAGNAALPKWAPVNATTEDHTPEGVIGLGGNVSEWTSSLVGTTASARPIVRGGNWSDRELDLPRRMLELDLTQSSPTVGFRTASSQPPAP